MLRPVVRIIILASVCCAQELLTCLRTDNALTQQSLQTPQRALQGSPGEREQKSEVGLRVNSGKKGNLEFPLTVKSSYFGIK